MYAHVLMQLARVEGIQGRVFEAVGDFQRLSKEVMQNLQYSTNTGPGVSTSSRPRGQRQNQRVCYPYTFLSIPENEASARDVPHNMLNCYGSLPGLL